MKHTSSKWKLAQFLEIRWWRRYLSGKDEAAYREQKIDYWKRICAVLGIGVPPGSQVLEAGCGPAGIFLLLDQCKVDAVDPLIGQYEQQLDHFRCADYPWVRFHSQKLEEFEICRPYTHLFCLNAINHVDDWTLALRHLREAAGPGTQLILGVDVHRHQWLKQLFRLLPGDLLHPHQHDRADYRRALESLGWAIKREHTWKKGRIFDYWLLTAHC